MAVLVFDVSRGGQVLLLSRAVHVYVPTAPCNLKKSFEGLTNEVRQVLAKDPLSGHVFVFLNRRKTQVKLLLWTRGGFTIVTKRLERGTFTFPARVTPEVSSVEVDVHELSMLLEGIDVTRARASRRWPYASPEVGRSVRLAGGIDVPRGIDR